MFLLRLALGLLALFGLAARLASAPEAILVVVGDQHSAYERTAQFVARIDRLRAENAGVPLGILIDGDALEYGNAIARRTEGAVDFAMFAALARRGPTVVNLGNHEPEFHGVEETVARLRAAGVVVLGANLGRAGGGDFAPASATVRLGPHTLAVGGVVTDRLATFRIAIRPTLDLRDPVAAARRLAEMEFKRAPLPVLLSHAGLKADREILAFLPDGTLFAGAHDHLRFVHRSGRTVYFHSGSWLDYVSVARLERRAGALHWAVEQVPLRADDPADPELAKLIRDTLARHLTPEETAVVGRAPRALSPAEAARFAVEAARVAAGAEAAMIGATTFGAGLPAGEIARFAFDACVRFDGSLFVAEVDGAWLRRLVARGNQEPDTPFADRAGENLVVAAPALGEIDPARRYRFVTSDWAARNAKTYFGDDAPALTEHATLRLKPAVLAALPLAQ